jgi:hypothetical protein
MKIQIALEFAEPNSKGYIGKPYWPERNTLINIAKDVNPKLGEAKKAAAVAAACEKRGVTPEQYTKLIERAARPFYTRDETRAGEIVIPERAFQSFINHASMEAPRAVPRVPEKGLTFIGVRVNEGFFHTGKTEKDAQLFERFVKNEESNQRMWSSDPFIVNFSARGVLILDETIIKSEELKKLLEWGGHRVGIGGARPQGFGRFRISRWDAE